ncbi:formate dehydrogenase accessory sulfurtransferase FdhD [Geoalkalibacter halelectricus]|uniref:formate dehydrogenase accessory sulfurtransferase FdhD n=1 Tax=Geoalkalibacter halelectricus TaxID=2847045 RepID=UPI003D1B9858
MDNSQKHSIVRFERDQFKSLERSLVQEYPLELIVNDRPLATLVASPHRLNFLVMGFLRLQGFIDSRDDILSLGVCADFGSARVQVRGAIPERLKPTLTSGCGTGISFNLPLPVDPDETCVSPQRAAQRVAPAAVFQLMKDLARRAEQYASHGGMHSAAVGDGEKLLLFAEDLGRHNTLDRIAGEALFRDIDLRGRMLVTSGRISTEMVGKAARLGIALIASRTSPTDKAVELAEQAGITLVGYVRGETFEVYSHAERLAPTLPQTKIAGITGVILAGGESRRMGCDKSLLPVEGARFIDHIYRRLAALFDEVIIVTNSPSLYQDLPCRKVPDIYYAKGALAGIHSGLCHARHERIFAVACDMPFLNAEVIQGLCLQADQGAVVVPQSPRGPEPLHALYHKSCLPAIEAVLDAGRRRIVAFFPEVQVHEVPLAELTLHDPDGRSFRNINTPEEYFQCRTGQHGDAGADLPQTRQQY